MAWRFYVLRLDVFHVSEAGSLTPGRDLQSGAMLSARLYAIGIIYALRIVLVEHCALNTRLGWVMGACLP